jgi:hypothetical protein
MYDPSAVVREQAISGPELRTARRAFQRSQLLAKREVLKDQFAMSAAGQRGPRTSTRIIRSTRRFCPFWARRINGRGPVLLLANDV